MIAGIFDNDVCLKLADCNLMGEAIELYGFDCTYILNELPYQAKPGASGKFAQRLSSCPEDTQSRLLAFIDGAIKLGVPERHDFIDACNGIQSIDTGETLLLEASLRIDSPIVLTGDKRFLKALGKEPHLMSEITAKGVRFTTLEHTIIGLMDEHGFPFIKERVVPVRERDQSLKVAFSPSEDGTETKAREALQYAINELPSGIQELLVTNNR